MTQWPFSWPHLALVTSMKLNMFIPVPGTVASQILLLEKYDTLINLRAPVDSYRHVVPENRPVYHHHKSVVTICCCHFSAHCRLLHNDLGS